MRQRGLDASPRPEVCFPHAQFQHFVPRMQARAVTPVMRTSVEPVSLARAVREAALRLDPEVPASLVRDLTSVVSRSTRDRRLNMTLFAA